MAKDAPIYKGSGEASESESMGGESFGHKVYKHLMNGVSHMLPFVVGGGIMIAIAFLIDSFGVDLASLPTDERANFGTILPQQHSLSPLEDWHLALCFLYWLAILP